MGVVCHPVLRGPLLHAGSHGVGHLALEASPILNDVNHLHVHVLGQVLVHFLTVEDLLSEILGRTVCGCFYVERLLLESLADNLKS